MTARFEPSERRKPMILHDDTIPGSCAAEYPPSMPLDEAIQSCLPAVRRWAEWRLTPTLRARMDASDLVQEAAVRLLARRDGFRPSHPGGVRAYMCQAVLNMIRDEARRVTRQSRCLNAAGDLACRYASPLEESIVGERRSKYRRALHTLKPRDRGLILARVDEEHSDREIAQQFQFTTTDAARVAVGRAVGRLRRAIEA
jgi:RNA polymerase sigma factor (sigma-70 family)